MKKDPVLTFLEAVNAILDVVAPVIIFAALVTVVSAACYLSIR